MVEKLLAGLAVTLVSVSCAAQVVPAVNHPPLSTSLSVSMNYWSADWQRGNINRWGPSLTGTVTVWHDLSIMAEGRALVWGGNAPAQKWEYYSGAGGVQYTSGYWGRFQPFGKAEAGFASLDHPGNLTGTFHYTSNIWTLGGGIEYHTYGNLWTRVEYNYDFFPHFRSSVTGQYNGLNPRGFTFGMTYRFGRNGAQF